MKPWQPNVIKPESSVNKRRHLSIYLPASRRTNTRKPHPAVPFVDFSKVDPVYPDKTSPAGAPYAYNKTAILNRGQSVLRELHSRPEKVIAVVSHSGFLRAGVCGCWFSNADYRVFDFAERPAGDVDMPYQLVQSEFTMSGGLGTCWTTPVVLGDGLPEADALPAGPE